MAQRGSWTDLSRPDLAKTDLSSPSLACRRLSKNRYLEKSDSTLRLTVRPDQCLKSSRSDSSAEEDNVTTRKSFSRAKSSIRVKDNSKEVPAISITDESDNSAEDSALISIVSTSPNSKYLAIQEKVDHSPAGQKTLSSYESLVESPSQENVKMEPDFGNLKENPIVKHANGGLGEAKKKEEEEEKEREVPAVTEEMLQKHSYHYYLMHNFFLSESSTSVSESEESLSPATPVKIVKKVHFNLEPEYIPVESELSVHHQCTCHQRNPDKYAYIQVAGTMFQTHWTTLDRHPDTLLGSEEKFQYYDNTRGMFTFPHIRQDCFESILFYYQDGILRSPKGVKEEVFLSELDFFGILHDKITVGEFEHELQESYDHEVPQDQHSLQARVFLLLRHKTTNATKVYTCLDIIFILTSVTSYLMATLPAYKPPINSNTAGNWTGDQINFYSRFGSVREFVIIDSICMVWFFAVFLLHYYAAPCKGNFLKSFQSAIDLILISAFGISIALAHSPFKSDSFLSTFVRLMFSLRILKLSQHSLLLNSLGIALKEASRELISVLLFVFVIVFVFACFEYFVEVDEPTQVTEKEDDHVTRCPANDSEHQDCEHHLEPDQHLSLMDYVWWSLITITTIGYGNTRIYTTAGKIVGALCAISGVPLFAIPIPILSKHLERVYQRELRRNKLLNTKMKLLSQRILTENFTTLSDELEDTSDSEETISWQKIVGTRRKSMGPQFAMTHFSNNT